MCIARRKITVLRSSPVPINLFKKFIYLLKERNVFVVWHSSLMQKRDFFFFFYSYLLSGWAFMENGCRLSPVCARNTLHWGSSDRGLEKVTMPEANVHFLFCTTQQKNNFGPRKVKEHRDWFFLNYLTKKFSLSRATVISDFSSSYATERNGILVFTVALVHCLLKVYILSWSKYPRLLVIKMYCIGWA